ncbi:type II toxin-antitoxin system VapB family antitoxin [uncultured Aliiroseovarius sp.]|uniref:type II toxin-antitoxin system VapB family antitoxin n=1 Tax=uncultured Aliiroseovarius sp. TaxID=1658783 RepID=UPI002599E41D|nr:type II toxin-antitoxin system VapB family antitoxin [uncultured Aliiroseovarius sp.]
MPDDIENEISRMVQKLMAVTGAGSEGEAILDAVRFQLRCLENPWPLLERLKLILERAEALGLGDPDFDMKAYLYEMWGEV